MIEFLKRIWLKLKRLLAETDERTLDYMVALPTPLDAEREAEMIVRSEGGDVDARNTLIEHNLRLVVYIAKRFENTGMDMEELISVGTLGLMKAVKSYNSEKKIKLATYASRCIENEILMYLRKMVKTRAEVSLDEPLNVDWEGNKLLLSDILGTDGEQVYKDLEAKVEKSILRDIFVRLSKRDRMILCMRYGLYGVAERTQKEIADLMGISQSYISRLEKKIIEKVKSEFEKTLE
ncbi:MAG TPA: sigma-70 family RNA polymerase sigma factor [Candidatus Stercoripulliclostridium merdipullorum]|uniref:RNA polymerase sigma factor n=1 Tax=Candidatus Stercoripulliclostridium merdipullorum TaxID=2840952 RepID=A0A9D1NBZ6_9FIRM|nr:sigma-70 family RNA polymerase sigma factor [Candidatus Stercoripulliclostridium merdipullorum]